MSPSDNSDSDISVDDDTPSKTKSSRRRNERDNFAKTVAASTGKKSTPKQKTLQPRIAPKRKRFTIDPGDDDGDDDADFNIHEAKKQNGDLFYSPSDDEDDAYQKHLKSKSELPKSKKKRSKTLAASPVFKPCLEYEESVASSCHDDNSAVVNDVTGVVAQQHSHAAIVKPRARRSGKKPDAAAAAAAATLSSVEIPTSSLPISNVAERGKITKERREAVAEFFKAYKIANADKSDDECRLLTVRELGRQGYNKETVARIVRRLLANNMLSLAPIKLHGNATPPHVLTDIRDKFHEYVQMVAEGDLSKISLRKFAISIGVNDNLKLIRKALRDDDIKQRLLQRKADEQIINEARRSLIIAKFIEFTGNARERRNACMRYFWKTPNYSTKTIFNACNRFLQYGTIRTHEKNKTTVWAGNEINTRACEEVTQEEAEYLRAVNAEHAWLACNLNLNSRDKRPQVLERASATTMASDSSDTSNNEGTDIVAALTARNVALEGELQESKNALIMSQMDNEQLRQQLSEMHRPVVNAEQ